MNRPVTSISRRASVQTGNVYAKYESEHAIERLLVSRFLGRLDDTLLECKPRRVLEIGTGEGTIVERMAQRFEGATVIGVDLYDEHLVPHWRARRVRGAFADACALPFADASFDLVLAIEVLEHLANPEMALREISRVASGSIVLSVPAEPLWRIGNLLRRRYWHAWGNTPGHVQHWGSGGFRRVVGRHLHVVALWRPLPWTMVLAERRSEPRHH